MNDTPPPATAPTDFALVFAANDGAGPPLAVALRTTFLNLSPAAHPEVFILDNGLSDSSRARLLRVVERARRDVNVQWIPVPADRLDDLAIDPRFTAATFARLLIPELIPPHIQRVVYLDADILVQEDVSPLFTVGLEGASLGAVTDFRYSPHFNAGVLVMDVPLWRRTALGDRILRHAVSNRTLDQQALNEVLEDDWHRLHLRWNVQHGQLFLEELPDSNEFTERLFPRRWDLYREAAILHFVGGPAKPWYHWCTTPGTTAWRRTLISTGWYTPRQALAWLLPWYAKRARFWLGTTRRRWWGHIRPVS